MSSLLTPLRVVALVALVLAGTGLTVLEHAAAGSTYCPDPQELRFLKLVNRFRNQNGVGPLKLVRTLGEAADAHSRDMGRHNYFSHTGLNGSTPTSRARQHGYDGAFCCGENIMWGSAADTANEAFAVWRDSPDHRANMLDRDYRAIGIGRFFERTYEAETSTGGIYRGPAYLWTTVFGGETEAGPRC